MSVFELPKVTLIPNGIHHPPIEDGRLLPKSVKIIFTIYSYKCHKRAFLDECFHNTAELYFIIRYA